MGSSVPDRYRRWFEYERDSHAKVLSSLGEVPEDLRTTEGFRKAVELLGHLVAARRLWLYRIGAASEGPKASEFFPENLALGDLQTRVEAVQECWSAYLRELTETELARVFEYQSLEGAWYRNTVEDILTQLFGHSWYHRGQIALLLRSIGAQPAVTDLVFWTREPIDER
jgi:uncharacterized damage-inducible protein DinB